MSAQSAGRGDEEKRTEGSADGADENHPRPIGDGGRYGEVDEASGASKERFKGGERDVEVDAPGYTRGVSLGCMDQV